MRIRLDRQSDVPLYIQIHNQIRDAILRGDITRGERLPAERQLAAQLGINRTTVVNAYRELATNGLVEGHVGRGTIVCWTGADDASSLPTQPIDWLQRFAKHTQWTGHSLVQEAADLAGQQGVISLASGIPTPELYPTEAFREACNAFLREGDHDLLSSCPAEGFYPLRQWLAEWSNRQGMNISAEHVLITSGSTQGLDLISRLLIEVNDEVVVETPTSLGALQCFHSARARLVSVPLDASGMRVDVLEEILRRHHPKFIYSLPTFQNPTGLTLTPSRREQLLLLVQAQGVAVIEDDPYSPLSYEGPSPLPLKALDKYGHVIYLSTFSKLLFPGLRLGWIVASRPVIERLALIKRSMDLFTNTLAQGVTWRFLQTFDWSGYLERLCAAYKRRRDVMIEALRQHCPPGLRWQVPAGGFYVWVRLPEGILSQNLLVEAHQTGVSFLPGEPFCPDGGGRNAVRLNFSYASVEDIEQGVKRLGKAVLNLVERRQKQTMPPVTIQTIV